MTRWVCVPRLELEAEYVIVGLYGLRLPRDATWDAPQGKRSEPPDQIGLRRAGAVDPPCCLARLLLRHPDRIPAAVTVEPTPPFPASLSSACQRRTHPRLCRPADRRRTHEGGDHPPPQVLDRPLDLPLPHHTGQRPGHLRPAVGTPDQEHHPDHRRRALRCPAGPDLLHRMRHTPLRRPRRRLPGLAHRHFTSVTQQLRSPGT